MTSYSKLKLISWISLLSKSKNSNSNHSGKVVGFFRLKGAEYYFSVSNRNKNGKEN